MGRTTFVILSDNDHDSDVSHHKHATLISLPFRTRNFHTTMVCPATAARREAEAQREIAIGVFSSIT
jgi:hypothetical protein